jgi:hypothetical protein
LGNSIYLVDGRWLCDVYPSKLDSSPFDKVSTNPLIPEYMLQCALTPVIYTLGGASQRKDVDVLLSKPLLSFSIFYLPFGAITSGRGLPADQPLGQKSGGTLSYTSRSLYPSFLGLEIPLGR